MICLRGHGVLYEGALLGSNAANSGTRRDPTVRYHAQLPALRGKRIARFRFRSKSQLELKLVPEPRYGCRDLQFVVANGMFERQSLGMQGDGARSRVGVGEAAKACC